jgi:hypothetical protein
VPQGADGGAVRGQETGTGMGMGLMARRSGVNHQASGTGTGAGARGAGTAPLPLAHKRRWGQSTFQCLPPLPRLSPHGPIAA